MTWQIAHTGHWLGTVLYLAPVVAIALAVAVTSWRDRRNGRD